MERTLKTLRVSRKFSLKDLAARVGCAPGTLAVYETNPPAKANHEIILALARVLDVTPEYILKLLGSTMALPVKDGARPKPAVAKDKPPVKVKARRAPRGQKAKGTAPAVFNPQQTALLMTLIRAEIKRLREFIVAAKDGDRQDAARKAVIKDALAELKALKGLAGLMIKD